MIRLIFGSEGVPGLYSYHARSDLITPEIRGTAESVAGAEAPLLQNNVTAGIGEGMAGADLSSDAATVAGNTESALRAPGAFDSSSPANRAKPVGQDVTDGVGACMTEYGLSFSAAIVASNVENHLRSALAGDAGNPHCRKFRGRGGKGSTQDSVVVSGFPGRDRRNGDEGLWRGRASGDGGTSKSDSQRSSYVTGEAQTGVSTSYA